MSVLNRPTTGYGLIDTLGARFSFARCSLAGTYLETGTMTVKENVGKTEVPTSAFLGYRYAYPGTKLLTGTIEGFGAAVDSEGISGAAVQSNMPQTGTPIAFYFEAGAFQVSGTIFLDDFDFSTGPKELNLMKWSWAMMGNPTIRRIYGMTEV